jgi:hypothetical protein
MEIPTHVSYRFYWNFIWQLHAWEFRKAACRRIGFWFLLVLFPKFHCCGSWQIIFNQFYMNIKDFRHLKKSLSISNVIKRRMRKQLLEHDTDEFITKSAAVLMATYFCAQFSLTTDDQLSLYLHFSLVTDDQLSPYLQFFPHYWQSAVSLSTREPRYWRSAVPKSSLVSRYWPSTISSTFLCLEIDDLLSLYLHCYIDIDVHLSLYLHLSIATDNQLSLSSLFSRCTQWAICIIHCLTRQWWSPSMSFTISSLLTIGCRVHSLFTRFIRTRRYLYIACSPVCNCTIQNIRISTGTVTLLL